MPHDPAPTLPRSLSDRLIDLLAAWQDGCDSGHEPTPEQLCPDDETLREAVREHIAAAKAFDPAPSTFTSGDPKGKTSGEVLAPTGYRLLGQIAAGGMGAIYAAEELEFGREVAVKVLKPGMGARKDWVARFLREARITGRLEHPGIPPVHAIGQLPDGQPFLAMKLIRGRTLADLLADREALDTDLPRFVQIFEQIAQAVGFAHSLGIIHRDLKPANVMVGAFGEVQVMDWGLARELASRERERPEKAALVAHAPGSPEHTAAGQVMGTPAYMAPEQARGEPVDTRADVFALGGILCAILTGHAPFTGKSAHEVLSKAAAGSLVGALHRLERCGAEAELLVLCRWCLGATPEERPTDGQEVAESIAAYRAGVEERLRLAHAERASAEARADGQRRKRRWQLAALAAGALLILSGAAFALWNQATTAQRREEQLRRDNEQREKEREALSKTEQAQLVVRASRSQAVSLRRQHRFVEARDQLTSTRQLANSDAQDSLHEIDQAIADLELVRTLDAIWMKRSTFIWEQGGGGRYDKESAPPAYKAAFAARGLDVLGTRKAEIAAAIATSEVKRELVSALDDWAALEKDDVIRAQILEVARLADPGPWLERFRDPAVRADARSVRELSLDADVSTLAPGTIMALAEVMMQHKLNPTRVVGSALNEHPQDFVLLFTMGRIIHELDPHDAVGYYRGALAIRPDHPSVLTNLAVTLSRLGDGARGEEAVRRAITIEPNNAQIHYTLGGNLWERGDLAGAETAFQHALSLDPRDGDIQAAFGGLLAARGDVKRAEPALRTAVQLRPNSAMARSNLGGLFRLQGKLVAAEAELRAALTIEEKHVHALTNLAGVQFDRKEYRDAEETIRKALEIDPKYAAAYNSWGSILERQGDLRGAEAAFRKAIEVAPKDWQGYLYLGRLLNGKDDVVGAEKALRDAANLGCMDPKLFTALGVVFRRKGELKAAENALRLAIKFDPNDYFSQVNLGGVLWQRGEAAKAVPFMRRSVELGPKVPTAYFFFAVVLQDAGEHAEAETVLRTALKMFPKDANLQERLGVSLWKLERLDEAATELREAIRLDPTLKSAPAVLELVLRQKALRNDRLAPLPRIVDR